MTILEKIILHKRYEVAARKTETSIERLEQELIFNVPRKSFVGEIKRDDKVGIIAEFKRRSPSKDWINEKAEASEIAEGYEAAGASALSILTDANFFGGSISDLDKAFAVTNCPILRKDFIVDEFQIAESRAIGASAILLIAAALNKKEIKDLAAFATSINLEVLLEIHESSEIPEDLSNISAIGVNNRNLKDFTVDINRSIEIAAKLPPEIMKISESGLEDAATILELKKVGFKGFLIGEAFMKTLDPAAACANLINELKN